MGVSLKEETRKARPAAKCQRHTSIPGLCQRGCGSSSPLPRSSREMLGFWKHLLVSAISSTSEQTMVSPQHHARLGAACCPADRSTAVPCTASSQSSSSYHSQNRSPPVGLSTGSHNGAWWLLLNAGDEIDR